MFCCGHADTLTGRLDSVSAGRQLTDLVARDCVMDIKLERVALVHRAMAVFCDASAANYAVLQSHPNAWSINQSRFFKCLSDVWLGSLTIPVARQRHWTSK